MIGKIVHRPSLITSLRQVLYLKLDLAFNNVKPKDRYFVLRDDRESYPEDILKSSSPSHPEVILNSS